MKIAETPGKLPLERHLWRSYLRAAIIPLLLIELSFLAIYWLSSRTTYAENVATVEAISRDYLADLAIREADAVSKTLEGVSHMTRLFAGQTSLALTRPYAAPASERARYTLAANGVYHSRPGGDAPAVFFSGHVPVGPRQVETVLRSSQIDPVMKDIKASNPLIAQVYFNTRESYNRIYPAFDVLSQYPAGMNIPSYNFYYEADAQHNPARKPVWTDAYIDPAGNGWMVSSIAPVYLKNRLEAVVGIDLTIDTIIRQILDIDLRWSGYAVLVGRDGTILALPPAGERDFGVSELKHHDYAAAITSDTFKPERYNINKRPDLAKLAAALRDPRTPVHQIELGGRTMLASHKKIAGPDWQLVLLAPADAILADANALHRKLFTIGAAMAATLLIFYAAFFIYLAMRARVMSRRVAGPLEEVEQVMSRIGNGEYEQAAPISGIAEVDTVAHRLTEMGARLGAAHAQIVDQQRTVREAFERERRITRGQRRFINMLSHEFRTPLTVIDSCAQYLSRRAERLLPEDLHERSAMLKRAAARVEDVISSASHLARIEDGESRLHPVSLDISAMIGKVVEETNLKMPDVPIRIDVEDDGAVILADRQLVHTSLSAVIDNAARYSPAGSSIVVSARQGEGETTIRIADQGPGIADHDLPHVVEPYYRGANSTALPGAGVGLHLASTAIELHGGTLDIACPPEGGTIVTLHFPQGERARGEPPR